MAMRYSGNRKFWSVLLIVALVNVVWLSSSRGPVAAAAAAVSGQASPVVAAAETECVTNSEQRAPVSMRVCVAELRRSTRLGLRADCIESAKALQSNPLYSVTECRAGRGVQAEAIAQARAIAQLNDAGVHGDRATEGITANLQWEVRYPGGQVDLLVYDRTDTAVPIELVELKGVWNGGERAARDQLGRYVRDLPKATRTGR